MKHLFYSGKDPSRPVFLLLHGTGGSEYDLLPIAKQLDEQAGILSVRGQEEENGMSRFFKRVSEGIFDEENLLFRTEELYTFLDEASRKYQFDRTNIIAVGYSNGANIAGNLFFHYQNALKGAVLFHPMVPRRNVELPDLKGKNIFIGAGANDPLCPPEETLELHTLFDQANATVTLHWEHHGHQLTATEVEAAHEWYVLSDFPS